MKQLFATLLFLTVTFSAIAQDSTTTHHKFMAGFHGGVGPAFALGGKDSDFDYYNNGDIERSSITGFMAGIFFHYQIIPRMAICFEANFESKGYAVWGLFGNQWYIRSDAVIPWGGKVEYRYNFIVSPVLLKFKINKSKKRTEWFVKGGLSPELFVNRSVRFDKQLVHHPKSESSINVGWTTGFGVNIPIKKRAVLSLEVRDNLRIGNVFKMDELNLLVFKAGFGYKF